MVVGSGIAGVAGDEERVGDGDEDEDTMAVMATSHTRYAWHWFPQDSTQNDILSSVPFMNLSRRTVPKCRQSLASSLHLRRGLCLMLLLLEPISVNHKRD